MATKKSASTAKKSPAKKKTTSVAAKTTKAKATPVAKTRVTTTSVKSSASRGSKVFNFSRSPLLAASVAEFVGAFLLAAIVLASSGSSIVALFGLTAIVIAVGTISGAYVNPALTIGAWVTRRIPAARAVSYLVAQFLGALLALVVLNAFVQAAPEAQQTQQMAMFGQQASAVEVFKLSEVVKDKEWLFLAAELIGTAVFAFGVASITREKNRMAAGFAVGGSLFIGLTITGYLTGVLSGAQAGPAVLNPAVALSLQAFAATTWQNLWPLSVYLVAPAIGGVIGFALRDLIASENEAKA